MKKTSTALLVSLMELQLLSTGSMAGGRSLRCRSSPNWAPRDAAGPDTRVKITEEYASACGGGTPSSGRGRWSTSTTGGCIEQSKELDIRAR